MRLTGYRSKPLRELVNIGRIVILLDVFVAAGDRNGVEELEEIKAQFVEQCFFRAVQYRKDSAVFADEVLTEVANQMADLLKELNREKRSFLDLGISYEEKAFYDILEAIAKQFGFEYPKDKMLQQAAAIKKIVEDKSKYTDWAARDDIKAELKMSLILVLAEYGYPPVTNDEVYKKILEQAENFKRYNG